MEMSYVSIHSIQMSVFICVFFTHFWKSSVRLIYITWAVGATWDSAAHRPVWMHRASGKKLTRPKKHCLHLLMQQAGICSCFENHSTVPILNLPVWNGPFKFWMCVPQTDISGIVLVLVCWRRTCLLRRCTLCSGKSGDRTIGCVV